jgi:hypothetical protein
LIVEIYKITEVHVDLIGPWIIPQHPSKSPKLSATSDVKQPLQVLAITMIDPSTNLLELIVVSDKESRTMARAFDCSWLCRYPRPLICLHDKGTEFTGIEFQELLQSYGVKAVIATTANPQTNAILECTNQVIANQLRSLHLMSIELNSILIHVCINKYLTLYVIATSKMSQSAPPRAGTCRLLNHDAPQTFDHCCGK